MIAGTANQEIGEKGAVQAGQRGTAGLRKNGRLSASQLMATPKAQPRMAIAIIIVTDYTYSLEYRRGHSLLITTKEEQSVLVMSFERSEKYLGCII